MKQIIILPLVVATTSGIFLSCTQTGKDTTVSSESALTGAVQSGVTQDITGEVLTKTGIASYNSPAGLDTIEFSVSYKNGVITAANAKPLATHPGSVKNQ
jgi:hypothetical protein